MNDDQQRPDDELEQLFDDLWEEPSDERLAAAQVDTQPPMATEPPVTQPADAELNEWFGAPIDEPTWPAPADATPPTTAETEPNDWSAPAEADISAPAETHPEPAAQDDDAWSWFSPLPGQVPVSEPSEQEPSTEFESEDPGAGVIPSTDPLDLADLYDAATDEAAALPFEPEVQLEPEPQPETEPESRPGEAPQPDAEDADLAAWLSGEEPADATPSDGSDLFGDVDVVGAEAPDEATAREIDPDLVAISGMDRADDVIIDLDAPADDLDSHFERLATAGDIDAPDVAVIAAPKLERETAAERAKRTRGPGRLSRAAAAVGNLWHGTLGWRAHPERAGYVLAKMGLRFGLFFIIPVAIVAFASLPALGSAFPSQPFDASGSTLTWGRGFVEYQPADSLVQIDSGEPMSSRLVTDLRNLYDAYWAAYRAALADGDFSDLAGLVSDTEYDQAVEQIEALRARDLSYVFSASGLDARNLAFFSATPQASPERVSAGIVGNFAVWIVDDQGQATGEPAVYSSIGVVFSTVADQPWRISELGFTRLSDVVDPDTVEGAEPPSDEEEPIIPGNEVSENGGPAVPPEPAYDPGDDSSGGASAPSGPPLPNVLPGLGPVDESVEAPQETYEMP